MNCAREPNNKPMETYEEALAKHHEAMKNWVTASDALKAERDQDIIHEYNKFKALSDEEDRYKAEYFESLKYLGEIRKANHG